MRHTVVGLMARLQHAAEGRALARSGGASRSEGCLQAGTAGARRPRWGALRGGVLLAVLPAGLAFGEPGAPKPLPDPQEIRVFVERQMRLSRLPAVAVAIVDATGELYAEGFGSGEERPTPETPFLLGSVTKTFTALAVAQLVDRGRLAFDDPVVAHLPEFRLASADGGRSVTVRQLLHHTSGLSQWSGHDRRAQQEGRFDHIAPKRPPGARFEYSSLNYIVLGRLIEAVSGHPYGDYVRQNLFAPLEMSASFADLEAARRGGLITGHRFFYGLAVAGREPPQPAPLVPAGFLVASARDLGHYLSMLLDQGRFRERQVVSAASLAKMLKPWGGEPTGPGMAWGVGRRRIGHAGSTPTFSARLVLLPQEGRGLVVLTNVNSGPFAAGSAAVMDGLARLAIGEPAEPSRPDEILLKLGLLVLVLAGVVRLGMSFRQWSRSGFGARLRLSRRVLQPLVVEAVGALAVLIVLPRWIGVPLGVLLEYFPDLGLAMVLGVVTGLGGALMRSFVRAGESRTGVETPGLGGLSTGV